MAKSSVSSGLEVTIDFSPVGCNHGHMEASENGSCQVAMVLAGWGAVRSSGRLTLGERGNDGTHGCGTVARHLNDAAAPSPTRGKHARAEAASIIPASTRATGLFHAGSAASSV
jgi:hypothetical protein